MRILVLSAALCIASPAFADPAPPPARFHANPPAWTVGFPHDGSPLVRVERTLWTEIGVDGLRPGIFDLAGVEHPSTAEVREFAAARWTRLVPNAPMAAGADYLLRLVDPAQAVDALDGVVAPIQFTTGRSFAADDVPVAAFALSVTDDVCDTAQGCGTNRCRISEATVSGDGPGAWTTLRFFPEGAAVVDPETAQHAAFVDTAAGWGELARAEPDEAEEVCWVAVSEDAYGRLSDVSEPVCATIEVRGCDAGSATAALLLIVVPSVVRRRRPIRRS